MDEDKVMLSKSYQNSFVTMSTRSFTGANYFVKPTCINTTRSFGAKVSVHEGEAVKYIKNWVSAREV